MNKQFYLYDPKLIERARNLRKNSTLSEILLWEKLKGRQLLGYKFRRQALILNYIVDFYCKGLKLVIEIDGLSQDNKMEYDIARQKSLEHIGISVLRFSDIEVKKDIQQVLRRICERTRANPPLPLQSGN